MSSSKSIDYLSLQQELDELLESLQSGQISIDEAISAHKRSQEIINELEAYLKKVENKVTKIKKDFSA